MKNRIDPPGTLIFSVVIGGLFAALLLALAGLGGRWALQGPQHLVLAAAATLGLMQACRFVYVPIHHLMQRRARD
jgi:hypothetical protein